MDIKVKIIKENADGSANAKVEFDRQGLEVLVQWGLVAILTKAIDEYKVRDDETQFPLPKKSLKEAIRKTKK